MRKLSETKESSSFNEWLEKELPVQFKDGINILNQSGLLDILSNGTMGIIGIDGKEYPLPTLKKIQEEIRNNHESYKTKYEQGFTEFQITPLGLPLKRIIEGVSFRIKKIYNSLSPQEQKEFNNGFELDEELITFSDDNFFIPNILEEAKEDRLIYYPRNISENPQGISKKDFLEIKSLFPGFMVCLKENATDIPKAEIIDIEDPTQQKATIKKGKGGRINGREQLTTYLSPLEAIEKIKEGQYKNEIGMTLEDFLILILNKTIKNKKLENVDNTNPYFIGTIIRNPQINLCLPLSLKPQDSYKIGRLDFRQLGYKHIASGTKTIVPIGNPSL